MHAIPDDGESETTKKNTKSSELTYLKKATGKDMSAYDCVKLAQIKIRYRIKSYYDESARSNH